MRVRVLGGPLAILAIMLISSVSVAQYPGQSVGEGSSDIWVMNLDNGSVANVVAAYVNQDGEPEDTSVGATIRRLGNTSFPASSSGLSNDWLGSMVLYSDKQLASVAELHWQNVPTGDGWSGSAYSGYSEGANDIFFPYIMKSKHQKSIVTIQCVDTVDCEVSMVYRDREGKKVAGTYEDTIEPDSQESYDLFDATLNSHIPNVPQGWFGSMRVTSTQEIAGVAVMHYRQGYAADYNHFVPEGDTEIYFPFVVRRNFGGLWRGQSDWSALVVQNMVNYPIDVYLSFYDRAGGAPLLTFSGTIPALASSGYNTRYGTNGSNAALYQALGNRFLGSAIVTSTDPIVGVNTLVRFPMAGLAGGTQGLPGGSGKLIYPNLYRTKNGNQWTGYSGIIVQNVDPDSAADVHVVFRKPNGSIGLQFDDTIPANSSHGYNTRYGAETPGGASAFNVLGTSWSGTAIITTASADGVIGIVHNSINGTGYMYLTTYNPAVE